MNHSARLRPGDFVRVKDPGQILETLDGDGTLDGLPFMPEMLAFTGRKFRVARRVIKTCVSVERSTNMREFQFDDVVTLEDVRCSGQAHADCQKGCMIFWREAWLCKANEAPAPTKPPEDAERLRERLKTSTGPQTYFCQSSEILKVTKPLSQWGRFTKCWKEVRVGNCGVSEMAERIGIWLFWRIRRKLLGPYARGTNKTTPVETLNLRPGELVEVKPIESISRTLDRSAHNRGLYFTPDMAQLCGSQRRVERKLDRIIVDGTGEMRQMRNTVYLEDAQCGCSHVAFGGCPRGEFSYWREIWLRRANRQ